MQIIFLLLRKCLLMKHFSFQDIIYPEIIFKQQLYLQNQKRKFIFYYVHKTLIRYSESFYQIISLSVCILSVWLQHMEILVLLYFFFSLGGGQPNVGMWGVVLWCVHELGTSRRLLKPFGAFTGQPLIA